MVTRRMGRQPRPSRDVGGDAPGYDARGRHGHRTGRLAAPALVLTPEVRADVDGQPPARPSSEAGDLDRSRRERARRRPSRRDRHDGAPLHEVADYAERRMRAALSAMPERIMSATDVARLDRGPGQSRRSGASDHRRRAITFDFAGTDRSSAPQRHAVEAVTVSASRSHCDRSRIQTIRRAGGRAPPGGGVVAPSGSIVRRGTSGRRRAGNVEVSQRFADVCLHALWFAVPKRWARRSQRHDEQRPHRRRGWLLRDRRRWTGRTPWAAGY